MKHDKKTNRFEASMSIHSEKAESQFWSLPTVGVAAGIVIVLLLLPYVVSAAEYSDILRVILQTAVFCTVA